MGHSTTTRPEPMNASPHHPKVKVSVRLSDPQYAAGGSIGGKLELECRADKGLALGVIRVELLGIEELTSRDHSATSTFIHSTRVFQGPNLPPSNAVLPHPLPGEPAPPAHHYAARRGQTSFLFRFPLPTSSPGSIDFGRGLARVRYEVRAAVGVAWRGERRLVTDSKEVQVVEAPDGDGPERKAEGVAVGENGKIWAQGRLIGGVLVAGHSACLELTVKNHSTKKNSNLNVTLSRHLHLPNAPTGQPPLQLSDTLTSVDFHGPEYTVTPGVEGVAQLVFDIPPHARSVRGGARRGGDDARVTQPPLFEVRCIAAVTLAMGLGSKDIVLEIPVKLVHPSVLPPPPLPDQWPAPLPAALPSTYTGYAPSAYGPRPTSPYGYAPPGPPAMSPRPQSPYLPSSPPLRNVYIHPQSPYLDPARPTSPYVYPHSGPIAAPYVDHSRVWFPPSIPAPVPPQFYAGPSTAHAYYATPPQHPPLPPPRPASAQPPAVGLSWGTQLPSGLPASATMQQPLFTPVPGVLALTPVHEVAEPILPTDDGKGAIAARISHHLRTTSRGRSASPPATRTNERLPAPSALVHSLSAGLLLPPGGPAEPASPNSPGSAHTAFGSRPSSAASVHPPSLIPAHGRALPNSRSPSPTRVPTLPAPVLSPLPAPRPMLSPRTSFEGAPRSAGGTARSGRVEQLEALAAQADAAAPDMSGSLDLPTTAVEKTLPGPPVPSGKPRSGVAAARPRADMLFVPAPASAPTGALPAETERVAARTPPTPTIMAFSPGKRARSVGGGESALDALEQRLLQQVGTRKVEEHTPRPSIQVALVPAPIIIPPRRASAGPHTPLGDSAISSLTLSAARSLDERTQRRAAAAVGGGVGLAMSPSRGRPEGVREERSSEGLSAQNLRALEAEEPDIHTLVAAAEGAEYAASVRYDDGPGSTGGGKERKSGGKTKARDDGARGLRKAAKGRVAAWLENISPDVPPDVGSLSPSPDLPANAAAVAAGAYVPNGEETTKIFKSNKRASVGSPHWPMPTVSFPRRQSQEQVPVAQREAVQVGEDLPAPAAELISPASPQSPRERIMSVAPNPRSSGFVPIGSIKQRFSSPQTLPIPPRELVSSDKVSKPSARLPSFPPRPADPEVKYDVRSARGGKGGKVTAVAAMWTSQAQKDLKDPPPKPALKPSPLKSPTSAEPALKREPPAPKPTNLGKSSPSSADRATPKPRLQMPPSSMPDLKTDASSLGDLTAKRARMVKSPSVPAVVSSSLATPHLSSTASLARPSPASPPLLGLGNAPFGGAARGKVPPTVSEGLDGVGVRGKSPQPVLAKVAAIAASPAPVAKLAEAPAAKTEMAFGQARLRDLIKKYQQG